MVTTRRGASTNPSLDTSISLPNARTQTAQSTVWPAGKAPQQMSLASGFMAPASTWLTSWTPRDVFLFVSDRFLECIGTIWFFCLLMGIATYQGRAGLLHGKAHEEREEEELPMQWFDIIVRRYGPLLPLVIWGVRYLATMSLAKATALTRERLNNTLVLYGGISLLRVVIYSIHRAGLFLSEACRVDGCQYMSDHVLLGSSMMAAFTSEGYFLIRTLRELPSGLWQGSMLASDLVLCSILMMLTSMENVITARYFHPPTETVVAAAVGFLVFQMPVWVWGVQYCRGVSCVTGARTAAVVQMSSLQGQSVPLHVAGAEDDEVEQLD